MDRVEEWAGEMAVQPQQFVLPPDMPQLELDHEALEDLMTSIDERAHRRRTSTE
jgi:hypothetical protein